MKTIIFVRHGESEANVAKIQANETDKYPLTARGRSQVERLTQELALVHPNALYSSPVLRAAETAGIISRRLNIPVQVNRAIMERDWGRANGTRVSTFEEEVDLCLAADRYGIESISSITKRASKFMDGLSIGVSVAVTHADVIRGVVVHVLGINHDEFSSYGIVPETATMTVVKVRQEKMEVVAIGSPRATDIILRTTE
jgi:2,3-bisphosphoglycerate-dependent phosphoglycerate mutase